MAWTFDPQGLTSSDHVVAEWQRALTEKDSTPTEQWIASATQLRSLAAAMRDALLPMSLHHAAMVGVVESISVHLPERRGGRREE